MSDQLPPLPPLEERPRRTEPEVGEYLGQRPQIYFDGKEGGLVEGSLVSDFIEDITARTQGDSYVEKAKVYGSTLLGHAMGLEPLRVYENWDAIKDGLFQKKTDTLQAKKYLDSAVATEQKRLRLGELGFALANDRNNEELQKQIGELRAEVEAEMAELEKQNVSGVVDLLSRTRNLFEFMKGGFIEAGKIVGPAVATGAITGGALTGPLAPVGTIAGGLAGFGMAQSMGAAQYAMRVEGGQMYLDMLDAGVAPEIASPISIVTGGLVGAVETVQVADIISTIPGGKRLFGGALNRVANKIGTTLTKTAAGQTRRIANPFTRSLINSARHVGTETGEEVVQEVLNRIGQEVAKDINDQVEGTTLEDKWDRLFPDAWATVKQTVGPMALLNLPGLGANIVTGAVQGTRQTESGTRRIQEGAVDDDVLRRREEFESQKRIEDPDAEIQTREDEIETLFKNITPENAEKTAATIRQVENEIQAINEAKRTPQERQPWQLTSEEYRESQEKKIDPGTVSEEQVYHGTGAEFDKFSDEKIGTGEGAQVFGWGHYFTSEEAIASGYAKALGGEIRVESPSIQQAIDKFGSGHTINTMLKMYAEGEMSKEKFAADTRRMLSMIQKPEIKEALDTIASAVESGTPVTVEGGRHLYKATIFPGKEANWLDWYEDVAQDKRDKIATQLNQENIEQDQWADFDVNNAEEFAKTYLTDEQIDGKTLYGTLQDLFRSDKEASLFLNRAGIDGIRYPTGTLSGFGDEGSGGYNYVVFDPEKARIDEHTVFDNLTEEDYNKHNEQVHGKKKGFKEDAEDIDKQLSLFTPREDVPGTRDIGRGYPRIPGVPEAGQTSVRGTWQKHRRIDFTGMTVTSTKEVAELFSVYRHPRLEHFHVIYVDENNKILAHNAMSSGLPGRSRALEKKNQIQSLANVENRMTRLGASGYYLLHNHPSGKVESSVQDNAVTAFYARNVANHKGSIIIDHDTYNVITTESAEESMRNRKPRDDIREYKGGEDFTTDMENAPVVNNPEIIADIGFTVLKNEKDQTLFLAINNSNKVVSASPLYTKGEPTAQYIHQLVRNAGVDRGVVVTNNVNKYENMVAHVKNNRGTEFDHIVDVVSVNVAEKKYTSAVDENTIDPFPLGSDVVAERRPSGYVFEEQEPYGETPGKDEHMEFVRKAVEEHKPVPDDILSEYEYAPWAQQEIEQRKELKIESKDFETAEDFSEFHQAMDFDEEYPAEYYEQIWESANTIPANKLVTRQEGNRRFIESLTNPALTGILYELAMNDELQGFHGTIVSGGKSAIKNGKLSDAHYKKIMDQIKADPSFYREAFAAAFGDREEIQRMREEAVDPDYADLERLRREVSELRRQEKKKDQKIENYTFDVHNLKARLEHAEKEFEKLETQYREEVKDLSKSAKAEARKQTSQAKKETIQKERERVKELRKEEKERQTYRDYAKKLIKDIFRPPAKAMKASFREELNKIQSSYATKGPRSREYQIREKIKEMYKENPEMVSTPKTLQEMQRVSVHDLTIKELEELRATVAHLRERGRWERDKEILDERILIERTIENITESVAGEKPPIQIKDVGSRETKKETRAGPIKAFQSMTLRPSRLFNLLDGGKDGIISEWLYQKVNEAEDAMLRAIDSRIEPSEVKMKELGLTTASLGKLIRYEGKSFTVDEVISLYIGMQNKDSATAILYGNEIEAPGEFIRQLTPEHKQWADYLMEEMEGNYSRVNEALQQDQNRVMKQVDSYFPIRRQDSDYKTLGEEMADDVLMRSGTVRSYVGKGFTKERTMHSPRFQLPMKLGATRIWMDQVAKQEKYIAQGRLVKRLHRIFGNQDVKKAITKTFGSQYNDRILKYIDDVANPNLYKALDSAGRFSRMLRQNAALSYLAFNAVTMLKQAPSAAYYLGHASPFDLMSAAGQFSFNMRETIEFVETRDPQMKHRSMQRVLEEIKNIDGGIYQKIRKQVGRYGMWPIQAMDKAMTTIGWKATYDRSIHKGLSEQEAIAAAQKATLTTQPAARAKDIAEIYRKGEGWNWLLMFTNQLNQIWNITTYDIPNSFRQGEAIKGLMQITGLVVGAMAMGVISVRRPPEDLEEVGRWMLNQFWASVPIVGGNLKAGFEGWLFSTGVDPFPLAKEAGSAVRKVFEGDIDMDDIMRMYIEGMVVLGIPTVTPKRIVTAIQEGDAWELIGGPPEE